MRLNQSLFGGRDASKTSAQRKMTTYGHDNESFEKQSAIRCDRAHGVAPDFAITAEAYRHLLRDRNRLSRRGPN
jgi:hypothetical protein